jgi:hypothetical protein
MPFPNLKPTARQFDFGDWPSKTYRSQDGSEVRILYGSKRTNMSLDLSYDNISDANAELFFDHFLEVKGTYTPFAIGTNTRAGWTGSSDTLGASAWSNQYRYAESPTMTTTAPGRSSVKVKLIGVL